MTISHSFKEKTPLMRLKDSETYKVQIHVNGFICALHKRPNIHIKWRPYDMPIRVSVFSNAKIFINLVIITELSDPETRSNSEFFPLNYTTDPKFLDRPFWANNVVLLEQSDLGLHCSGAV